jgi:predicted dinucleotide-binding enzyme
MQTIGILGAGGVAKTLAKGFTKYGYNVLIGTREPQKLNEWLSTAGENIEISSPQAAAQKGEIIVLAVKGSAAETVIKSLKPYLSGKTIVDTTNPINGIAGPENGVLNYFTDINFSLMEKLQQEAPEANFVKCFNSVGAGFMVNPQFNGTKPSMFICGNNVDAKAEVRHFLDLFGWETEDLGLATSARAIEPLCMLWCIPGFRDNRWNHAFKLLKI